jgi:hypothetical protein
MPLWVVQQQELKYISSIYFRIFLVITHSAHITKEHINMLVNFHIFLTSRATFSYFLIFCLTIAKVMCHGNHYICYKCCFILLLDTVSGLLKSAILSVMIGLSQYNSTSSGLYLTVQCILYSDG